MNKSIQNSIEKVSNSFPSLFSREDVIKLLIELSTEIEKESPKPQIDFDILATTYRQVLSEKNWEFFVMKDEIELCLNWDNKIEVQNVPVDEDHLIEKAIDALQGVWEVLEETTKQG